MHNLGLIVASAALLAACGSRDSGPAPTPSNQSEVTPGNQSEVAAKPEAATAPDDAAGQGKARPAEPAEPVPGPAASASPCLVQDGKTLSVAAVRASGTEPFWGAKVEGRCITYSNPEDQKGTRVWTRYTAAPGGGTWSGTLGGRRFELKIRAKPGCSDGMSDKSYPLAADLVVGGERRSGCAEPL